MLLDNFVCRETQKFGDFGLENANIWQFLCRKRQVLLM